MQEHVQGLADSLRLNLCVCIFGFDYFLCQIF